MKKTAVPAKVSAPAGNGFATKDDIRRLKESINERFDRIEGRFEWFKDDWDWWKQDAFTEFNSRWVDKIDPILAEIEKHREKEIIWAEQNRRTGVKVEKLDTRVEKLDTKVENVENKMGQFERTLEDMGDKIRGMDTTLEKIAKKVGAW